MAPVPPLAASLCMTTIAVVYRYCSICIALKHQQIVGLFLLPFRLTGLKLNWHAILSPTLIRQLTGNIKKNGNDDVMIKTKASNYLQQYFVSDLK